MKRKLLWVILPAVIFSFVASYLLFGDRLLRSVRAPSEYEIYEQALGYTAFIFTKFPADTLTQSYDNQDKPELPSGTGFVIEEGGKHYIITGNHVVVSNRNNSRQYIQFYGEKRLHLLKKLGWDPLFDLAVLEFVDQNFRPSSRSLLGESRTLKATDRLYILGNPLGLKFLWSEGKVMSPKTYSAGLRTGFLAIDATCNPGNSGGPVIDKKNEVVGIVEAISGQRPICLATPIHILKILWPKLKAGGEIKHGMLGIELTDSWNLVSEEIKKLGLGQIKSQGAVVLGVTPGSPAERAGLKKGDVLLSFGPSIKDTHIVINNMQEFIEELNLNFFLGDEVALRIRRDDNFLLKKLKIADPSTFGTNVLPYPVPGRPKKEEPPKKEERPQEEIAPGP